MINYDVLKAFGTTNSRLREIFTAVPDPDNGTPKGETKEEKKARMDRRRKLSRDIDLRERWRYKIQSRVEEGICYSLKNWRIYAAVDLAWDSTTITKTTVPLQMYAQGKINVEQAKTALGRIKGGEQYIKKDSAGAEYVDVPRFIESNFNLVRSVISRRHAAQRVKYGQLWPYYKYEARSTGLVAKCRADVLSQRVDMMVDQFDIRHHDAQCMRDAMLYSHCFDFVRSSWEVEEQLEPVDFNDPSGKTRNVITKEGIGWVNPHPTRVASDPAHPPSSINTDTGCSWLLFWDVGPFRDIDDNPDYYNKDSVGWSSRLWSNAYGPYQDYFSHYQYSISPPFAGSDAVSFGNDRKAMMGIYAGTQRDSSVFLTNYFEKFVPKDWGVGDYPFPVWGRFVVASDSTVVFAEIMPSTPAAYLGINENDSRQVNVSMAMDLFSAQDQMTNLLTHLLLVCQIDLLKIIGLNTDVIDADKLAEIRKRLSGRNFFCEPQLIEYSLLKLQEVGIRPEQIINIAETRQSQTITSIFEAIAKLVELTEKLFALSPAEQGQPAPREISATEVNEIASTTSSIYSGISEDIDEFRAAKKRISYESVVACSKGDIVCPVKERYTPNTIRKAGFTPAENEEEDFQGNVPGRPRRQTVIGSKRFLIHDYIFTTRDGAERPVNTQAANTLVQLIAQVLSVPMIAQALGKEKLYELFNEVFRLSGAGVDLNLTMKEGEEDGLGEGEIASMKETVDQITQYINQLAQSVQKNSQDIASQEQVNQQQEEAIKGMAELADRVRTSADHINELQGKHEEIQKRLVETISYKDAPDSIKAQMEAQAGFTPAPASERQKAQKADTKAKTPA